MLFSTVALFIALTIVIVKTGPSEATYNGTDLPHGDSNSFLAEALIAKCVGGVENILKVSFSTFSADIQFLFLVREDKKK